MSLVKTAILAAIRQAYLQGKADGEQEEQHRSTGENFNAEKAESEAVSRAYLQAQKLTREIKSGRVRAAIP